MKSSEAGQKIPDLVVLNLSQRGRAVVNLIESMMQAKQTFLITQAPTDAAAVATRLRAIAREAEDAALAFEAAAKIE